MVVQQSDKSSAKSDTSNSTNSWKTSLNISGGKVLQLSVEEAASVATSKLNNLRNLKKLALVLDLDHTLLHAIQIDGATPSRTSATPKVIEGTVGIGSGDGPDDNVVHHLPIEEIDRLTVKHLVMKKRPGLDYFLDKASEFCQMTVYTAGTRRYAEAVARVIDPTRRYFADRIVSRCDVANIRADGNEKSLERIYPGDASMAVIIDDREDVWRGPQSAQLLLVRPFVHFDPRPSEAAAAMAAKNGMKLVGDNAAAPLPDALGTVARGVPVGGPSTMPVIASPIITLCAGPNGEPAGRIAKVAPLYSFEHSSMDDQLSRCLQMLNEIHAEYYSTSSSVSTGSGDGSSPESKDPTGSAGSGNSTNTSTSNGAARVTTGESVDEQSRKSKTSAPPSAVSSATMTTGTAPAKKNVATILQDLKKKVLAGCTITFSGLIPTNEENPRNHTLWRLAESLGAQVSMDVLPRTTHLISIHTQTQKVAAVLQRRASEVWVLHPDWLIYCRWSLSRAQESTFMLNQLAPGQSLPTPKMNYSPIKSTSLDLVPANTSKPTQSSHQHQQQRQQHQQDKQIEQQNEFRTTNPAPPLAGQQPRKRSREEREEGEVDESLHKPSSAATATTDPVLGACDGMLSTLKRLKAATPHVHAEKEDFMVRLPIVPSNMSVQNSSVQSTQIGTIKKKVDALVLENDGDTNTHGKSNTEKIDNPAASCGKYSPDKIPVAKAKDFDHTFRVESSTDLQSGESGDDSFYFSEQPSVETKERRDDERSGHVLNDNDDDEDENHALRNQNSRSRRPTLHRQRSNSSDSSGNSLLGEGDGEFQLYDEDGEGGESSGGSAADEGMLCCNDDQDSTCSATPLEGGETWGQRKIRRRREGRSISSTAPIPSDLSFTAAAAAASSSSSSSSSPSMRAVPLNRNISMSSNAASSASASEDDCDFEVMIAKRRAEASGSSISGIGIGTVHSPIVLDEDDDEDDDE